MPRKCVFFELGSGQHGDGRRKGKHCLRCLPCLILEDSNLKDAVLFACGGMMQPNLKNKREGSLRDVDPLYLSDGKKGPDNKMFRNRMTVEMPGEGYKSSAMD